jgi:hypothetical protein
MAMVRPSLSIKPNGRLARLAPTLFGDYGRFFNRAFPAKPIYSPAFSASLVRTKAPQMLFKTFSTAVYGIDANIIEVEVDVSRYKLDSQTAYLYLFA